MNYANAVFQFCLVGKKKSFSAFSLCTGWIFLRIRTKHSFFWLSCCLFRLQNVYGRFPWAREWKKKNSDSLVYRTRAFCWICVCVCVADIRSKVIESFVHTPKCFSFFEISSFFFFFLFNFRRKRIIFFFLINEFHALAHTVSDYFCLYDQLLS